MLGDGQVQLEHGQATGECDCGARTSQGPHPASRTGGSPICSQPKLVFRVAVAQEDRGAQVPDDRLRKVLSAVLGEDLEQPLDRGADRVRAWQAAQAERQRVGQDVRFAIKQWVCGAQHRRADCGGTRTWLCHEGVYAHRRAGVPHACGAAGEQSPGVAVSGNLYLSAGP